MVQPILTHPILLHFRPNSMSSVVSAHILPSPVHGASSFLLVLRSGDSCHYATDKRPDRRNSPGALMRQERRSGVAVNGLMIWEDIHGSSLSGGESSDVDGTRAGNSHRVVIGIGVLVVDHGALCFKRGVGEHTLAFM